MKTSGHSAFKSRHTDQQHYTISYKSLDEADAQVAADYEAVVALAQVTSRIKVQHAAMGAPDPAIDEFCTHRDEFLNGEICCSMKEIRPLAKLWRGHSGLQTHEHRNTAKESKLSYLGHALVENRDG